MGFRIYLHFICVEKLSVMVDGVFNAEIMENLLKSFIVLQVHLGINESKGNVSFLLDDESCSATCHEVKVIYVIAMLVKLLFFLNVNNFQVLSNPSNKTFVATQWVCFK